MNQTQYTNAKLGVSQENAILQRLQAARGGWVSMPELSRVSGSLNVHSRIACLREDGHNIPKPKLEREGSRIRSFYRIIE